MILLYAGLVPGKPCKAAAIRERAFISACCDSPAASAIMRISAIQSVFAPGGFDLILPLTGRRFSRHRSSLCAIIQCSERDRRTARCRGFLLLISLAFTSYVRLFRRRHDRCAAAGRCSRLSASMQLGAIAHRRRARDCDCRSETRARSSATASPGAPRILSRCCITRFHAICGD